MQPRSDFNAETLRAQPLAMERVLTTVHCTYGGPRSVPSPPRRTRRGVAVPEGGTLGRLRPPEAPVTYPMLDGLRVVELGEWVSAPYCGKLLADLGAEVVKVERAGVGDPAREYGPYPADDPHPERSGLFLYLNSNKKGTTLNLDTPTGKDVLAGLVASPTFWSTTCIPWKWTAWA